MSESPRTADAFPGPVRNKTFHRAPTGVMFVNSTVPSRCCRVQTVLPADDVRGARRPRVIAGDAGTRELATADHPPALAGDALVYSAVPSPRVRFQTVA